MTAAIDITAGQRKTLLALLRRYIPGVAVWAYGSRVKWTARPNSDLDLVAFTTPEQQHLVSELKEALAESDLPFLVDFHVWDDVPERFHEIIRKEYVVLQEAAEKQLALEVSGKWGSASIQDVSEKVAMGPFGSSIKVETFVPHGVPVISGQHLHGTRLADLDYNFISLEHADQLANANVKRGDVVFTHAGNIGQVAYIPKSSKYERYVISQRQFYLRPNTQKVLPEFIAYYFTSADGQHKLLANASSSGVPSIAQPVSYLRTINIPVPPLVEQRAITHILGTLDDKIELNRRMNATLEAMARTLFQSWFVDFDPVRAKLDGRQPAGLDAATAALFPEHFKHGEDSMLPVGWRSVALDELCAINAWTLGKNDNLSELEYVEISEVSRGNIANIATYTRGDEPSRARRRLRHGDTVLSTVRPDRGSYFLALNPPENRVASTGFAVLTPTKAPWSFIHAAMTQPEVSDYLGQMADGGAYPAVRPEIIGSMKVALPNEPQILDAFHRTCAPLFEQAEANRAQSRTLAILRDALLPRLLSGDIRVTNLEDEVASV